MHNLFTNGLVRAALRDVHGQRLAIGHEARAVDHRTHAVAHAVGNLDVARLFGRLVETVRPLREFLVV
jgi:hypothetical protein